MASLPTIEYNYYIFKPATPDSKQKKYQILEAFFEYKLIVDGEAVTRPPGAKFFLGWDRAILYLYQIAYVAANVACILAALTMGGWVLGVSNLTVLKAIIVIAISSRCINYLDQRMMNKSFEIAAKVVRAYGKSDDHFDRAGYIL